METGEQGEPGKLEDAKARGRERLLGWRTRGGWRGGQGCLGDTFLQNVLNTSLMVKAGKLIFNSYSPLEHFNAIKLYGKSTVYQFSEQNQ